MTNRDRQTGRQAGRQTDRSRDPPPPSPHTQAGRGVGGGWEGGGGGGEGEKDRDWLTQTGRDFVSSAETENKNNYCSSTCLTRMVQFCPQPILSQHQHGTRRRRYPQQRTNKPLARPCLAAVIASLKAATRGLLHERGNQLPALQKKKREKNTHNNNRKKKNRWPPQGFKLWRDDSGLCVEATAGQGLSCLHV